MTNRELITSVLRMLNVLDSNEIASSEDAVLGLDELNDLMADLLSDHHVDLGYVRQSSVNAEFPCDDAEAAAIKPLLAMRLYSHFPSVKLPPTLPARAERAQTRLVRDAVLENMEEASLSNLPAGEGRRGRYNIYTGN
jgi:hypothetical protein